MENLENQISLNTSSDHIFWLFFSYLILILELRKEP